MKIRTLIVDDEPLARRGILSRLDVSSDIEVVDECENGRQAVEAIRSLNPDLVFLDVQMPGMDGFDVLRTIGPEAMPLVIFVTAYDQHALRAFDVHALDYLLKPIDDHRFYEALNHVRAQLTQQKESDLGRRWSSLLAEMKPEGLGTDAVKVDSKSREQTNRFIIKTAGRIFFVKAEEIDWIEAAGDYVCLHVGVNGHLLRETMSVIETRLDPSLFLRIHRSTIVNTERISELRPHFNGEYQVLLLDGTQLKTSRSYRERLQTFYHGDL